MSGKCKYPTLTGRNMDDLLRMNRSGCGKTSHEKDERACQKQVRPARSVHPSWEKHPK